MESNPQLMLEDARSIREGLLRMSQIVQDAAEYLDARMESEDLDGQREAEEVREALEQVQEISLEVSEELNAYQSRHGS